MQRHPVDDDIPPHYKPVDEELLSFDYIEDDVSSCDDNANANANANANGLQELVLGLVM